MSLWRRFVKRVVEAGIFEDELSFLWFCVLAQWVVIALLIWHYHAMVIKVNKLIEFTNPLIPPQKIPLLTNSSFFGVQP